MSILHDLFGFREVFLDGNGEIVIATLTRERTI
jgi:hypothetical protein